MIDVDTPHGRARVRLREAPGAGSGPARPRLALVLGHGAGGGVDSSDLRATGDAALELGLDVALVEQPYRVAGRRSPAPARQLDTAWVAVVRALFGHDGPLAGARLVAGGRSSGGRVACRCAAHLGAVGVLCLAFPLLPPGAAREGDETKSRRGELDAVPAGVPVLVVQGERDPFGMPPAGPDRAVITVPGTHTLTAAGAVRDAVTPWLALLGAVAR